MPRPDYYGQLQLHQFDPEVGRIWRTRDDDLEPSPAWGMSHDLIVDPEPSMIDSDWLREVLERVDCEIREPERKVLEYRMLGHSLHETAAYMQVSVERIRQIEAKAYRKIRDMARRLQTEEETNLESRLPPVPYTVWDVAGRPWFQGTQMQCMEWVAANPPRSSMSPWRILRNGKTPPKDRLLT